MKRSLGAGEWVRRGLGVAVLVGVAAIALGLDTGFLTRLSLAARRTLEQSCSTAAAGSELRDGRVGPDAMTGDAIEGRRGDDGKPPTTLPVEGTLPSLAGAVDWLNSPPLTAESLKGKVVLVDFWTYSCINCLRAIPYVRAWAEKYKDQGLVVIGVHAPEFAFEKNVDNVQKAVADLKIAIRSRSTTTTRSGARSTTSTGRRTTSSTPRASIRHHHFGEGDYDESERVIQQLLAEAGQTARPRAIWSR